MPAAVKPSAAALAELASNHALVKTFLKLISVDTTADETVPTSPSNPAQLKLSDEIIGLLESAVKAAARAQGGRPLGADRAPRFTRTKDGVTCCAFAASSGCEQAPHLALLSHLDTSPDCSGAGISPELVKAYPGGPIALRAGLVLDDSICPELSAHVGEDIIVTDGTTLLGADDKAGCTVLIALMQEIIAGRLHHGALTCVFTVDEEIGRSAGLVPVPELKADFGVTVDGCEAGELDTATFNASGCEVTVTGRSIHTGSACGKLVSALKLAAKFIDRLPVNEAPETTSGLEGFYHPYKISGGVERAVISLILRDFETEGLKRREQFIAALIAELNFECGAERFKAVFTPQYRNLAAVLQEHPQILTLCRAAYKQAGVPLRELAVRGGTDGSNLSYAGLPCPNMFCGALNCHGPYECLPVPSLEKALNCARALVELTAKAQRSSLVKG